MSTVYVIEVAAPWPSRLMLVIGTAFFGYVLGAWRHGGKFPAGLCALASMFFAASVVIGALA